MTPTLYGRWQTRILLLSTLGIAVTVMVALYPFLLITPPTLGVTSGLYLNSPALGLVALNGGGAFVPFVLLGYALALGLIWDIAYQFLQTLRWNRDWPPIFALLVGLWEGGWLFLLSQTPLPDGIIYNSSLLIGVPAGGSPIQFWIHYGLVFGSTFLASLGLLHVLMPKWRYQGGQWI